MGKIKTETLQIPIDLKVNGKDFLKDLNRVKKELLEIQKVLGDARLKDTNAKNLLNNIDKITVGANKTNNLDSFLNSKGTKKQLRDLNQDLANFSKTSQYENYKIKKNFESLSAPINKVDTALGRLQKTFANSFRYNLTNNFIDSLANSFSTTFSYLEKTDKYLNRIQIVSSKTSDELRGLLTSANEVARDLGQTTTPFLQASEIYYQQGLAKTESNIRAQETIKAANISGQGIESTANQVTAVLNGFQIQSSRITEVLDKMAAVGAGTATDFEEIAKASQKMASAANSADVDIDHTLGMIATISSNTREAPEAIGTSLNSIMARFSNLHVQKGTYTSDIEKAFQSTNSGLTIFDEEGQAKNFLTILDEVSEKWDALDKNQKKTITSAMAGSRQANRLLSLLDNYDQYRDYTEIAIDSEGALDEQNEIYKNSLEAIKNETASAKEALYNELFNPNQLKEWYSLLTKILDGLTSITGKVQGLVGVAGPLLSIGRTFLMELAAPSLTKMFTHMTGAAQTQKQFSKEETAKLEKEVIDSGPAFLKEQGVYYIDRRNQEFLPSSVKEQHQKYTELHSYLIGEQEKLKKLEKEQLAPGALDEIQEIADFNLAIPEEEESPAPNLNKTTVSALKSIKRQQGDSQFLNFPLAMQKNSNPQIYHQKLTERATLIRREVDLFKNQRVDVLDKRNGADSNKSQIRRKEVVQALLDYANTLDTKAQEIYNKFLISLDESDDFSEERLEKKINALFSNKTFKTYVDNNSKYNKLSTDFKTLNKESQKKYFALLKEAGGEYSFQKTSEIEGQNSRIENKRSENARYTSYFKSLKKAVSLTEGVEKLSRALPAVIGGMTSLKTITDETLEPGEKFEGLISGLGTTLSAFPSTFPLGIAISTLGPLFLEITGIGKSSFQKLEESINKTKKSVQDLTEDIILQGQQLKNISPIYDKLVKKYEETNFHFEDLTDIEKGQYQQVADYVSQYVPELIKYYDEEGKAILDLSKKYSDGEKVKKNYLKERYQQSEYEVYSPLTKNVGNTAHDLIGLHLIAKEKVEDYKQRIIETREAQYSEGKDYSKKLTKYQEELSKYEGTLQNIHKEWNNLFTDVILKGNPAYQNLDINMKNTLRSISSYSSFVKTNFSIDANEFALRVEVMTDSLANLDEKQREVFENMSAATREGLTSLIMGADLRSTDMTTLLEKGLAKNGEEYLFKGGLFNDIVNEEQQYNKAEADKNYQEKEALELEIERHNKGLEVDLRNVNTGTGGAFTGGAPNAEEDKERIKELTDTIDDFDISENVRSEEEIIQESLNRMAETFLEIGQQGPEAFNSIATAYNEMVEAMDKEGAEELSKKLGFDTVESLQEYMGAMYAALNANNRTYYRDWVGMNQEAIQANLDDYGIYTQNYETYAEYMDAINQAHAIKKVIYEKIANGDLEGADKALANFKKQQMLQLVAQERDATKVKLFLSLDSNKQKEYADNLSKIRELENYKEELRAVKETEKGKVKASGISSAEVDKNHQKLVKSIIERMNKFAASTGGDKITLEAKATEKYATDATIDEALKAIDKQIEDLESKNNKVLKEGSGKELSKYDDVFKFITDQNSPNYNYNLGDKFKPVELKEFKKKNGFGNGNETTSTDGGSKTSEVEDLKFKINLLKRYEDQIAEINHQLDLLKTKKDKAYGADYINILEKESKLNKEKLEVQEKMLKEIDKISNKKKKELSKDGVKFDSDGLILNYNDLLKAREKSTNKLKGEAKKKAKKEAEDLKKAMDEYEEYALKKARSSQKEIENIKNSLSKLAREQIEYGIKIIIDASKKEEGYIDFLMEVQKLHKGKINFSLDITGAAKNAINALETAQQLFKETGNANNFLNKIYSDPNLKDNKKAQLEMIIGQQDKMQSLGKQLIKFSNSLKDAFANSLDKVISLFEKELRKFDDIMYQYDRIIALSDSLKLDSFDNNEKIYSRMISLYKNNLNSYNRISQEALNSRDSFEKGSSEWVTANTKYLSLQKQYLEEQKKLTGLLEKRYDSAVSSGREDLEKMMFGGMTEAEVQKNFNKLNAERDKYLDTEEKIYQLSKLQRDISKDIDSYEYDPDSQKELKDFMERELKYLKGKEKITQDDLELTQKQYNVIKARIDLERAYNNEQYSLMLQRNEDGTFGYMYVQNTDSIKEAQQKYEDSINELYKFSSEKNKSLQQESLNIRKETLKEYDEITKKLKDGTITEEEATKKLNEAFKEMNKDLEENARQQAEMQQQMASAKLLQILGVSKNELGSLENQADSIKNIFDILYNNGEISDNDITSLINRLGLDTDKYIGTTGEKMKQIFEDLGGDSGAMATIMKQFSAMDKATATTILGLLSQTGDLDKATQDILNESLKGTGENFDKLLSDITNGTIKTEDIFTESFENGLDDVGKLWSNLSKQIKVDLDKFRFEFDVNNKNGLLGSVINNINLAYKDYYESMKESYDKLLESQKELQNSTEEYNKDLDHTLKELEQELEDITKLTQKYADLRKEVNEAIDEILKYVEVLNSARQDLEKGKTPATSKPSTGSTSHSNSSSKPSTSNKKPNSSSSKEKPLNNGQRVKIVKNQVYSSAYDKTPSKLSSGFYNSNRKDLFIDGTVNGRKRVKQKGSGYVGWFNPSAIQAFHTGGLVDVNREGLALLKKNEIVFNENQVDILSRMRDLFEGLDKSFNRNIINDLNKKNNLESVLQNVNINAYFPNATGDPKEIKEAIKTLYMNSSQYLNKR